MNPRPSYKQYLKAVGRKPIPAYDKLRTPRAPGDRELPAATKAWWKPALTQQEKTDAE